MASGAAAGAAAAPSEDGEVGVQQGGSSGEGSAAAAPANVDE